MRPSIFTKYVKQIYALSANLQLTFRILSGLIRSLDRIVCQNQFKPKNLFQVAFTGTVAPVLFGHFQGNFQYLLRSAQSCPITFGHFPAAFLYLLVVPCCCPIAFKSISQRLFANDEQRLSFSSNNILHFPISKTEGSQENFKNPQRLLF